MSVLISPQDALVYIMVTASAADETINAVEADVLTHLVRHAPVFEQYDDQHLQSAILACKDLLSADEGMDAIFGLVAGALPKSLYETAYALAVEISAADRQVTHEELVFLEMLADRFDISKLAVAAIEHSARVRYRRA